MPPRHFLDITDLRRNEVDQLLDDADRIRAQEVTKNRTDPKILDRDAVAFITSKQSHRTDLSIKKAARFFGGDCAVSGQNASLTEEGKQRESLLSRVLSTEAQTYPIIFIRWGKHQELVDLLDKVKTSHIVNALTDDSHPLQALADIAAFRRAKGKNIDTGKPKIVFAGDGNNVATSLGEITTTLGWNFVFAGPDERRIPDHRWARIQHLAKTFGGSAGHEKKMERAVEGAWLIYGDVFASMGQKSDAKRLGELLKPYRVDETVMERAGPQALYGHCLPANEGEEVSTGVLYGPQSIAYEIAGARMDTTAALIKLLLNRN
jgi:ornithine carbamoyltransferase